MTGEGRDRIGAFLIRGKYNLEDGKCQWAKRYVGLHDVAYQGFNEGKGIWGIWEIPPSSKGGFHIWPEAMGDPTQPQLAESADPPAEEPAIPEPAGVEVGAGAGTPEPVPVSASGRFTRIPRVGDQAQDRSVRATTATTTCFAPARLSARAAAPQVAPVVSTSSTSSTVRPRIAEDTRARKASPRTRARAGAERAASFGAWITRRKGQRNDRPSRRASSRARASAWLYPRP